MDEATLVFLQCLMGFICMLLNLLIVVACVSIASKKNRNPVVWGLLGFFFTFFALLIILLLPPVTPSWPAFYRYGPSPYPPVPASPPHPTPPQPMAAAPVAQKWAVPSEAVQTTMVQKGWRLTIVAGPDSGQSYALAIQNRIGRNPDNDIRLTDPQVSRHHALIQQQGEAYVVSDLGSGNGTYVNGRLISGPNILTAEDTVSVGNTQMRVK